VVARGVVASHSPYDGRDRLPIGEIRGVDLGGDRRQSLLRAGDQQQSRALAPVAVAVARPMPLVAPLTTTVRPRRSRPLAPSIAPLVVSARFEKLLYRIVTGL